MVSLTVDQKKSFHQTSKNLILYKFVSIAIPTLTTFKFSQSLKLLLTTLISHTLRGISELTKSDLFLQVVQYFPLKSFFALRKLSKVWKTILRISCIKFSSEVSWSSANFVFLFFDFFLIYQFFYLFYSWRISVY